MPITDGWPDAGDYPYRALIRIRYAYELDLRIVQHLQGTVVASLEVEAAETFVKATTAAAMKTRQFARDTGKAGALEVDAKALVGAGRTMSDSDELCPRRPKWPFPPRGSWADSVLVYPVLEELTRFIEDGDLRGAVTEELDAAFSLQRA